MVGRMALAVLVVALGVGAACRAEDGAGLDAKAAFDRLKSLDGEWTTRVDGHGPEDGKILYHVTAGGSTVMETMFPGADHEMISMYHLDGDELLMTHYCAMGNQPRMKLDRANSGPDELRFVFDGGTNFDPKTAPHIHSGRIHFEEDGGVTGEWDAFQGGRKARSMTFRMSRPR